MDFYQNYFGLDLVQIIGLIRTIRIIRTFRAIRIFSLWKLRAEFSISFLLR